MTGNIVHLGVLPGTLVSDCTRQCMYADTWSCGTPVYLCSPFTINLSMAKMKASGGNLRLSTWDGDLLHDRGSLSDSCKFFRLTFMKQVGYLLPTMSSLSDSCVQGPSILGQMPPPGAHVLDALLRNAAMGGDNNITVDISGTKMVVNPVHAKDESVPGILYQWVHTARQCMLQ